MPKDIGLGRKPAAGTGGVKKASCDPDKIKEWWLLRLDAMLGLVTGPASGVFVVDLDAPKQVKCGPLGERTPDGLAAWKKLGIAVPTYEVETPGNGRHVYFKCDGHVQRGRA